MPLLKGTVLFLQSNKLELRVIISVAFYKSIVMAIYSIPTPEGYRRKQNEDGQVPK